jgi:hypothetical protein
MSLEQLLRPNRTLYALTKPTIPAPIVTLHKLAYAPNNELFFSSSFTGTSLITTAGRLLPLGVLTVDILGLEGRKNGDRSAETSSDCFLLDDCGGAWWRGMSVGARGWDWYALIRLLWHAVHN